MAINTLVDLSKFTGEFPIFSVFNIDIKVLSMPLVEYIDGFWFMFQVPISKLFPSREQ